MAQPSVASYFSNRKRTAIDDLKVIKARKVLLDSDNETDNFIQNAKKTIFTENNIKEDSTKTISIGETELQGKIVYPKNAEPKIKLSTSKKVPKPTKKKVKDAANQRDIQQLFNKITKKNDDVHPSESKTEITVDHEESLKTPPPSPSKKVNAMDKINISGRELNMSEIKHKLTRSSRLAELKASMSRFNESAKKLEKIEEKSAKIPESPSLKSFRSIELEVVLSPKRVQSPEKAYLSPRKDTTARRNLLNSLTPTKNAISIPQSPNKQLFAPQKASLTLPYKYRTLAELFRSIDTVCQIMHNRKETITYRKLKPAVEELLKRNLQEKHLAQIKTIYPTAFKFRQEKLRVFGTGTKQDRWELLIEPVLSKEAMTADALLERRRIFFNTLIDKVKKYHYEFLLDLDPPMVIAQDKITRWHPEFDIERVPDIEMSELPQPPNEEKFTTGKDVLEKARTMFNCNTRMEQALVRLKEAQENRPELVPEKPKEVESVLKGIPKALLEKVRQKQAAKALESMTRSDAKDKEVQLYSRLPEFARLMRNLYVAEKKSVMPIDTVLEKLGNSLRSFMSKTDMELHLKTLAKEVPGWIAFHTIRNSSFIKISKDTDLSLVINKLDKLHKLKVTA